MTRPADHETRISRLEIRVEEVAADATAARHLVAANDRDYADLAVEVDANRTASNALGAQTPERFDQVDRRFDRLQTEMRTGFVELRTAHDDLQAAVRHGFDQTAAGSARIAELIAARDDR